MADTKPLTERLEIKAMMIQMGERIAYGSDSGIMHEAVAAIKNLQAERDALLDRMEKAEKDAVRLDWLEQNLFNRENVDWITGEVSKTHNMWVTFAPVGVQGSARRIIDAGMEASK